MVLFPPAFSISTFLNVKWYHGFGLGFDDVGPVLSLWLVCHVWVGRVLSLPQHRSSNTYPDIAPRWNGRSRNSFSNRDLPPHIKNSHRDRTRVVYCVVWVVVAMYGRRLEERTART